MAASKQVGDGTNFVILLAGALLEQAEDLIRMGLKPTEIIEGYEIARDLVLEKYLPSLTANEIKDARVLEQVTPIIRSSVMSKQYGREELLANIIARACISVHAAGHSFNVDNVRVCKIVGSGVSKIDLVQGMVFKRQVESTLTKVDNAKVVIFTCPVDISATETKGTVLIKSADELRNFSSGEENLFEEQIKAIAESGVNVIVSGGKFGDLAGHYCNKYKIMMVRLQSKFDVRRLAKTVNATVLPKLGAPRVSEIGMCDSVYIDEIGDTPLVVFKQKSTESHLATIVVRGSTDNIMDDIERAIDDGVNTYKSLCNDGRIVYGAGATEIELAQELSREALQLPGMEQYAVGKFAEALQSLPAALADNAGIKSNDAVTLLIAAHQNGEKHQGVDIESDSPQLFDTKQASLYDLYATKYWGVRYATNAACTVLKVDQIICAKPAGGPKPRENQDWDQD
jgi:T-complex protein 1 subunit theta